MNPSDTPTGSVTADELKNQADKLGLVWKVELATIKGVAGGGANITNLVTIAFDSDPQAVPVSAISTITGVGVGYRVYVMVTPTNNYVIGTPRGALVNAFDASGTGTKADGVVSDYPGSPTVTLNKLQAATAVVVRWAPTFFTDDSNTGPVFAVLINGTDYFTHRLNGFISVNVHLPSFGERRISGVPAGQWAIVGRWARSTGLGTLHADGNDFYNLTAEEL